MRNVEWDIYREERLGFGSNYFLKSSLGSFWWEIWKIVGLENGERMKKLKDKRDFSFPHFCLVGVVEK